MPAAYGPTTTPIIVATGASPMYSFSLMTAELVRKNGERLTEGKHSEDDDESAKNGIRQVRNRDLEGSEGRHDCGMADW